MTRHRPHYQREANVSSSTRRYAATARRNDHLLRGDNPYLAVQ
ncbi:MAG: hypothetical protein WCF44_06295 [Candidatus Methylophosphatis roskildensis]